MRIVFLGAPGSGKGTQSKKVEEALGLVHISTGDIFRSAMANKTEAGLKAKDYMDKGYLVPDEVTLEIVKERLLEKDCEKGFIFDGFPRTLNQAIEYDKLAQKLNLSIDKVIYLEVDKKALLARIGGRRVCPKCGASYHIITTPPKIEGICDACGEKLIIRKDDNEESLKIRLDQYETNTAPLISYYKEKGLLVSINSNQEVDKVFADILGELR